MISGIWSKSKFSVQQTKRVENVNFSSLSFFFHSKSGEDLDFWCWIIYFQYLPKIYDLMMSFLSSFLSSPLIIPVFLVEISV